MSGADAIPNLLDGIAGKLGDLSDEKLLMVFQQLAVIPDAAIVPALLDEIRPRLRKLRPPRPLTLKRILCTPFEDLFESPVMTVHADDAGERISRTAIDPCWRLLQQADPLKLEAFEVELRQVARGLARARLDLSERFWRWAAATLATATVPDAHAPSIRLMADALFAAPVIEEFKRVVPGKPVLHLGEFETPHLVAGLARLAGEGLSADVYLLVVAARLANPGEVMAFHRRLGAGNGDEKLGRLSGFAVARIDEATQDFARDAAAASPDDIARAADKLMATIAATREVVDDSHRARLEVHAQAAVATLRGSIKEHVIDTAAAAIDVALPTADGPAPLATLVAAEDHARALGRSRRAAGLLGLGVEQATAVSSLCARFEKRIDQLMGTATASPISDKGAENAVYRAIRMIELLDGPQRAQRLFLGARQRLRPRPRAVESDPWSTGGGKAEAGGDNQPGA